MEEIIGRKFLNSKLEEVDPQEIFKCKIICLFFTASWCTPCEIFSKELIEIYNEGNQGEKLLEIIQVSYEKPEINIKQIVTDKPWLFIPLGDSKVQELTKRFSIETIPIFLVLDQNGNVISDKARSEIVLEGSKIVEKWLDFIET